MTLQLYVLRQLLISLGFALAGIGVVVMPSIAIQAIHKLGGVSLLRVIDYLPLVLVELVPYLFPMAFLLAVVATFGRLAADRELTAIQMAGIAPWRLFGAGLVVAVPLALVTGWLLTEVSPAGKYERRNFLRSAGEEEFRALGRGRTEFELGDDYYVKAERRDGDSFVDVLISAPLSEGTSDILVARRATFTFEVDHLVIDLEEAELMTRDAHPFSASPRIRIPLDVLSPRTVKDPNRPKYMRSSELLRRLEEGELTAEQEESYRYQIHQRRAMALTYLVFLLLGAPTGVFLRSGTQLAAFAVAVGYAFLYYLLAMRLGKQLALGGVLEATAAAWTTDALFLAVGGVLAWRVMAR